MGQANIGHSAAGLLKTLGGLAHGQGITDSTQTKWVHVMPRCIPI